MPPVEYASSSRTKSRLALHAAARVFGDWRSSPIFLGPIASEAFGPKSAVPGFETGHAMPSISVDHANALIAAACAEVTGLEGLTFTPASGPSTLESR
jgi:hypothetical protein